MHATLSPHLLPPEIDLKVELAGSWRASNGASELTDLFLADEGGRPFVEYLLDELDLVMVSKAKLRAALAQGPGVPPGRLCLPHTR